MVDNKQEPNDRPTAGEGSAQQERDTSSDVPNAEGDFEADGFSSPIDDITKALVGKLTGTADASEVEKILTLVKAKSEIRKLNAEAAKTEADKNKVNLDASLAKRQMRHALLGSMFAPLVPIASLLTVVVSLIVSSMQTQSSNELALQKMTEDKIAREDANWAAFEADLDKTPPDRLYSSGAFMARFHTFAASDNHKKTNGRHR
jgi:hypothetical protein